MATRYVVTAIALVFFSLPIALRVAGMRTHEFENHSFAVAPKLSQGWDAFPQTTRFFTDRMPLREQAVTANRNISETIFDTTPTGASRTGLNPVAQGPVQPTPAVTPNTQGSAKSTPSAPPVTNGKDGWLFLTDSLNRGCKNNRAMPLERATKAWIELIRTLRTEGKNVVLAVVPDKETIYPEQLPDTYAAKDCSPQGRAELWQYLEAVSEPGFLPMRREVLAAKRASRVPVFRPPDAHWNAIGAMPFVRKSLEAVSPRIRVRDDELRSTVETYKADLLALLNEPAKATTPSLKVARSPSSPKIQGRTRMLMDSYGFTASRLFKPYFYDLDVAYWQFDGNPGTGNTDITRAKFIADADSVVIETGERNFFTRAPAAEALTTYLKGAK